MPDSNKSKLYFGIALVAILLFSLFLILQIALLQTTLRVVVNAVARISLLSIKAPPAAQQNVLDTSSPALSNVEGWKTYRDEEYGFEFKYPNGWTFTDASGGGISFFPPGKKQGYEYYGDIIVEIFENPSALDLRAFYKTVAGYNLFLESGTSTPIVVNDMPAVKFFDVYGMIPTNMVAIKKGKIIIEIRDIGVLHEDDGIFDAMAKSIH